jgi:serine/threonine protein kinase
LAAQPLTGLPPELAGHAKFHIVRELGRGGMGVVYQAEHRLMKRPVAIKVLTPRLVDNPTSLARFHQEVEAAAQLSHPNIVAAHDAEQAGSLHLLVMEYVEGQSLAQVLERKGPLPIMHACKFAWQAAKGLQHACDKKMVHRDIKPQNLMLTPQGVVKILDFGLARLAERPQQGGLTQESVTMGTPEYIAPEQASDARQADIRSDIYSLGCTLYALLGGRPPFSGETAMQIILAHIAVPPPPLRELRPEVPEELAAVVAKMIAKEPRTVTRRLPR